MRARFPVVHVQDDDGDDDGEADQDHGKEDVFAEEGQGEGGRGDDFGDEEEEHGLGEEDVDAEGDLFAGIGGEVED